MPTIVIEIDVAEAVSLLDVRVNVPAPVRAMRIALRGHALPVPTMIKDTMIKELPYPGKKIKRNDVDRPIEPPLVAEYVGDSKGGNLKRIDIVASLAAMGLTIDQLTSMKTKKGSPEERLRRAYVMQKIHRDREGVSSPDLRVASASS